MTERKLKKSVVYSLYALSAIAFFGGIYLLEGVFSNKSLNKEKDDFDYVSNTIFESEVPVVSTSATIIRPYKDENIKIVKDFYDYEGEEKKQQEAIIYYEGTYMPNTGVSYGSENVFDVVSILDGEVISVKEDQLLGKIVEIRHSNDIISIYQSLSDVTVKEKDTVTQGQVIGKSGNANISKELNNHLYFELIVSGQTVNPEAYFDKALNEI